MSIFDLGQYAAPNDGMPGGFASPVGSFIDWTRGLQGLGYSPHPTSLDFFMDEPHLYNFSPQWLQRALPHRPQHFNMPRMNSFPYHRPGLDPLRTFQNFNNLNDYLPGDTNMGDWMPVEEWYTPPPIKLNWEDWVESLGGAEGSYRLRP